MDDSELVATCTDGINQEPQLSLKNVNLARSVSRY